MSEPIPDEQKAVGSPSVGIKNLLSLFEGFVSRHYKIIAIAITFPPIESDVIFKLAIYEGLWFFKYGLNLIESSFHYFFVEKLLLQGLSVDLIVFTIVVF